MKLNESGAPIAVELQFREDFTEILKDYKVSDESRDLLASGPLVILLSVFAGGRNSIIDQLVSRGNYRFIVSDTTRPPKMRNGRMEKNGVQYFFRSEEEILSDLREGKYLEAELIHNQQVSGISIRELKNAIDSNKIPIDEIDIGGTENLLNAKPDTDAIFIVPPSYSEWIMRINNRDIMSQAEFENRMKTARRAFEVALNNPKLSLVINDSLEDAADQIDNIVSKRLQAPYRPEKTVELIKHLLLAIR
jgi:guanylate kinase